MRRILRLRILNLSVQWSLIEVTLPWIPERPLEEEGLSSKCKASRIHLLAANNQEHFLQLTSRIAEGQEFQDGPRRVRYE